MLAKLFKKNKNPAVSSTTQTAPEDLFRSRGDDNVQNGDYDRAVMMYDEALRYASTDTTILLSRSFAQMMLTPPRLDLALRDADTAIQHCSTSWQAWSQKGETHLKMGDINRAEEAFVNAVRFAKGADKLNPQRSLADIQSRRSPASPADPSSTSVKSTPSTPFSEISASIPPVSHPSPATATSSTTEPTTTTSGSAPSNMQTSASTTPLSRSPPVTPTSSAAKLGRATSASVPPAPSNTQTSAPTTPVSRSPPVTPTSSTAKPTTTPGSAPPAPSNIQTSASTTPFSYPLPVTPTSSSARPSRTTSGSALPAPSNTQTSASTTPLPRSPPVMPTSSAAKLTRLTPGSAPPAPSNTPASAVTPTSSAVQPTRTTGSTPPAPSNTQTPASGAPSRPTQSIPVVHTNDSPSVTQAPVRNPPPAPEDLPPGYTPSLTNPNPTVRALSEQALVTQLTQLLTTLAAKNKGSISLRPYTTASRLDAVQTVYVGMTQLELTARELGTPTHLHPSFRTMAVDTFDFPGNTFIDMDCESSGYYEGKIPGTVSISGYSGEYREQQLLAIPLLNLILESENTLPTMALDKIVSRIQLLRRQPTLEDNEGLRDILGLSQLTTLQSGFHSGTGSRQRQIEAICMALNRSLYDAPTRFIDFSKARNISDNTLGSSDSNGIGLRNFLFQILLGAELLIRLRKEPAATSYVGLVTDATSALMVLSASWMENVTIHDSSLTLSTAVTAANLPSPNLYILVAEKHRRQAEGLIRFGETLSWPYMDEARNYIENAYQDLISNKQTVDLDTCDWLYGLSLPGKIFRHRIMCCLVYASSSIRSFNPAPFWDNGLVVKNKSYWPRRSVLGRVLSGLKNPRSICGWIGPLPAPEESFSGWIRLNARRVDIPVPVSTTQTSLESLGFGATDETESPDAILESITDPNEWIQACPPSRPTNDSSCSVFKAIHLTEIPSGTTITVGVNATVRTSKEYRASLDFEVNGSLTRYTLYSNPIFVYAPPCVGTHTMHRRRAQNYLDSVVRVADLKEAYAPSHSLVIIDALGQGEEVVARAWCAERGRHAVIRRGGECCFTCATAVAAGYKGLGINVVIWSK